MFETFRVWPQILKNSINSKRTRKERRHMIKSSVSIGTLWMKNTVKIKLIQMDLTGNTKRLLNMQQICPSVNMAVGFPYSKIPVLKTKTSITIQIFSIWTTFTSHHFQFCRSRRKKRNSSVVWQCLGFIWEWCFLPSAGMLKTSGSTHSTTATRAASKLGMSFLQSIRKNSTSSSKEKLAGMICWIASPLWSTLSKSWGQASKCTKLIRDPETMFAPSTKLIMLVSLKASMLERQSISHRL